MYMYCINRFCQMIKTKKKMFRLLFMIITHSKLVAETLFGVYMYYIQWKLCQLNIHPRLSRNQLSAKAIV